MRFKNNIFFLRLVLTFICVFAALYIQAQMYQLKIQYIDTSINNAKDTIDTRYNGYAESIKAMEQTRWKWVESGFFTCSIDTFYTINDSIVHANIYIGKKYFLLHLENDNVPEPLLNIAKLDFKKDYAKPISLEKGIKKLSRSIEFILQHYENHGYPFASVQLSNINIIDSGVKAKITINKGPLIKWDTIYVNEEAPVSHHFISRTIGIREGEQYNESKLKAISTRIKEIPFIQESAPWRVDFNVAKNKLNMYLKSKPANRADVLIGMQPSTQETGGKFLLTGDIKMAFLNTLGYGEQLQINWQNLQYKSPRYDITATIPYVFSSPFGVSGKFNFYKKDTSFRTVQGNIGLLYDINELQKIKLYYDISSSRLGTINTNVLLITRKLPSMIDVSYHTIGTDYIYQFLDYRQNPRKGYQLHFNIGLSLRNVLKNNTIESTYDPVEEKNFGYLYDSIKLKNQKYLFSGDLKYFLPLGKRTVLALMYHGGSTFSNSTLYKNELFQIGGYNILRGFDEGSLFVSQYHIGTLEPRYIFSGNSYFFLLCDFGYYRSRFADQFLDTYPISAGLGMAFETKSGIFNISYAVGKSKFQQFELKNSKIHFGYISVF